MVVVEAFVVAEVVVVEVVVMVDALVVVTVVVTPEDVVDSRKRVRMNEVWLTGKYMDHFKAGCIHFMCGDTSGIGWYSSQHGRSENTIQ